MYQTTSNFASSVAGVGGGSNAGGSRIKVAVRIRPLLEYERNQGHDTQRLKVQGNNEVA